MLKQNAFFVTFFKTTLKMKTFQLPEASDGGSGSAYMRRVRKYENEVQNGRSGFQNGRFRVQNGRFGVRIGHVESEAVVSDSESVAL